MTRRTDGIDGGHDQEDLQADVELLLGECQDERNDKDDDHFLYLAGLKAK